MTLHTEQGNLERAFWFQKFIVRKQRSQLHFQKHKNGSAFVRAHYLLDLWQNFSENHVKYVEFQQVCLAFVHVVVLQMLVASAGREALIG